MCLSLHQLHDRRISFNDFQLMSKIRNFHSQRFLYPTLYAKDTQNIIRKSPASFVMFSNVLSWVLRNFFRYSLRREITSFDRIATILYCDAVLDACDSIRHISLTPLSLFSLLFYSSFPLASSHRASFFVRFKVWRNAIYAWQGAPILDHNVPNEFIRSYNAWTTYTRTQTSVELRAGNHLPSFARSFATPTNGSLRIIKIDAICAVHCSMDSDGHIDTSTSIFLVVVYYFKQQQRA